MISIEQLCVLNTWFIISLLIWPLKLLYVKKSRFCFENRKIFIFHKNKELETETRCRDRTHNLSVPTLTTRITVSYRNKMTALNIRRAYTPVRTPFILLFAQAYIYAFCMEIHWAWFCVIFSKGYCKIKNYHPSKGNATPGSWDGLIPKYWVTDTRGGGKKLSAG